MSVQNFRNLYKHFVKVTCSKGPSIVASSQSAATPVDETPDIPDESKLNPLFKNFCEEGERHFSQSSVGAESKAKYDRAIEEYLTMKQAAQTELHILCLNRVGQEKNFKN